MGGQYAIQMGLTRRQLEVRRLGNAARSEPENTGPWVLKLGQAHLERAQERAKGISTGTPMFQGWVEEEMGSSCKERTRVDGVPTLR